MRLKSLELTGFKSFLDETSIGFASGVTAVVGPNGCGKSNVVDAIRWVLGEQAPTRLRGKTSEDLIYAGNDSNAAAGMAEVTLVLEAEEGSLLPEPYSALSEVAVTRRAYRSGDSEYLMNRISCRLKDITEFFMAAQIHSRGYSIIEQGRIEDIIQSKPHEIRTLIEEAAGLSLYKGRREMSERKLERVKENLARLDDVLGEIDRQLSYARRQAKKAEQYRIFKSELTELERLNSARRIFDHRGDFAAHSARSQEIADQLASARAAVAHAADAVEDAARAAQTVRGELGGNTRELESIRAAGADRTRSREFLNRKLDEIAAQQPAAVERIAALETDATASRAAHAHAAASLAREMNQSDAGSESALADLSARLHEASGALANADDSAEDVRDRLAETVREAAVVRSRLADLSGERAELDAELGRQGERSPALDSELERARAMMSAADADIAAMRDSMTALESIARDRANAEMESRGAVERLGERVGALEASAQAALKSAAVIPDRGTGARLLSVLESLNGDRPASDPPILSRVVHAPAPLEGALRAVLGDELEAVVVEGPAFPVRAIDILKEKHAGRLSFIQQQNVDIAPYPAIDAPGISGRLVDMIQVDPGYSALAESMLGRVMVANDLRSALAASNLNGHGTVFVTREGDVVEPGRMIRGGSSDDESRAAAAAASAAIARVELDALRAESARAIEHHRSAAASRQSAEAELRAARERIAEFERELGARRDALSKANQAVVLMAAQAAGANRRIAELSEASVEANTRLTALAQSELSERELLTKVRDEVARRRAEVDNLATRRHEMAARVESRRAEIAALERDLAHAVAQARALDQQIGDHRESLERALADRAEFESELAKLAAIDAIARERESELRDQIDRLRAQCEQAEHTLDEARAIARSSAERTAAVEAEASECALKRERAHTLADELARAFEEKFAVEFDACAAELEVAIESRDGAADEARASELRGKLERIGEVNLAAESEVKELEERATKLGADRTDLQAALDDLARTIAHLNKEARKRFAETFEGAARNFEDLFPKLLRGGKGRLELSDESDVLEAGVNIMVQPAGKKVKELGLLSGGEKALSAMALIFSLFLLNPSPFCVMDEVDAPLDEFSLAAFTSLMSELKSRSQFIVITHNQRTMQRSDQIHGVTMDRPGISRIISLKIPQAA